MKPSTLPSQLVLSAVEAQPAAVARASAAQPVVKVNGFEATHRRVYCADGGSETLRAAPPASALQRQKELSAFQQKQTLLWAALYTDAAATPSDGSSTLSQ